MNTDSLLEMLRSMIRTEMAEINTALPGRVVSYDAASNRAVVSVGIAKRLADGSELAPPRIVSVPIKWPAGSGGAVTFPIAAGDPVELNFHQRSLEQWLDGGSGAPQDPRMFDLSDCSATPGLAASGLAGDMAAAVFRYKTSSMKILESGAIVLTTAGGSVTIDPAGNVTMTGNLTVGGTITSAGAITGAGINNVNHRHVIGSNTSGFAIS